MADDAIHYIAQINHVKEVILFGTADLAFWRERLRTQGLFPSDDNGQAALLITATDLVWLGIRFQELTVSIMISQPEDGGRQDGFYLVRAFNSSHLLALAERTFFRTPYHHAQVQAEHRLPASFALRGGSSPILRASMKGARPLMRRADEQWEGTIFLPRDANPANAPDRYFFARLGGDTETYPFSSQTDLFELASASHERAVQWLIASNFRAQEWRLRANATHARSRTYIRPA